VKTNTAPPPRPARPLSPNVRRREPRSCLEWKTLRRWKMLPEWEEIVPGYVLREAREDAGLTQVEMGRRLGCSQQAVAQSERWESNPTVAFAREWARALGKELDFSLPLVLPAFRPPTTPPDLRLTLGAVAGPASGRDAA
jgi:DNA-binding XRE family transcriptional regulator